MNRAIEGLAIEDLSIEGLSIEDKASEETYDVDSLPEMLVTLTAGGGSRSDIIVSSSHHEARLVPTGIVYNTQTLPKATKSGSAIYDPEVNIDLPFALMGDAQPSEADME